MRTELLEQLKDAYEYHRILLLHQQAIKELEKKKKSCEAQRITKMPRNSTALAVIIGFVVFFIANAIMLMIGIIGYYIAAFSALIDPTMILAMVLLGISAIVFIIGEGLAIAASICLPMVYANKDQADEKERYKKYFETVYTPTIKKINEELKDTQESLTEHTTNKTVLDFLPPDYRSWWTVFYMYEAVENYRADTLKEVINLYEEQLHRWSVEDQMEEQRRVLNKMAIIQKNTEISTKKIQNMAALFGGYIVAKEVASIGKK